MYKYVVEIYEKSGKLMLYKTVTADGYCAEIEARKKYPNCTLGLVAKESDYKENV